MFWVGLMIIKAYSLCDTYNYVACLANESLNKCSQQHCEFDNILFENGKVYYLDGEASIELEIEDKYFELPPVPEYIPIPRKNKPFVYTSSEPENLSTPSTECEGKCYDYCSGRPKCINTCNAQYCVEPPVPQSPNYILYIFTGFVSIYIIRKFMTPRKYLDGYFKLE
jgi:hypothetical protein